MGTHGRRGLQRAFIGSVTEGVLRGSDIPVLTINFNARLDPQATHPFRRAVVAVDDSEPARAAVDVAIAFAQFNKIALRFVTVLDTVELVERASLYGYDPRPISDEMRADAAPVLEAAAQAARVAGIDVETALVEGHPVATLVEELKNADLGIMGSHGRQGLQRLMLGSVAEDIVRGSPVPVLVVRRDETLAATRPALARAQSPVMMAF
jgi:nucleotide-binding universal stress UspA family protein